MQAGTYTARRRLAVATAVVLLLTMTISGCASSSPSCAAPEITLSTTALVAGENLVVHANNLWQDCADTGQGVSVPATDVQIVLTVDGDLPVAYLLATADADETGAIEETVQIPEDVLAGPASVSVGDSSSVSVNVLEGS